MTLIISSVLFGFVLFFVLRIFSKIIFKPLTAHWFAIGLTLSFILGALASYGLIKVNVFEYGFQPNKPAYYHLALSWLIAIIPLNLIVLPGLYWWDKRKAIKSLDEEIKRIPENALHALAFCGGILGAFLGQQLFHHKVTKASFQIKHYAVSLFAILLYLGIAYELFIKPHT